MTATVPLRPAVGTEEPALPVGTSRRPRARLGPSRRTMAAPGERGIVSAADRRRPAVRAGLWSLNGLLLIGLVGLGLGPMLWLVKAALTSTQDTLRTPLALFPSGVDLGNLDSAWNDLHISRYFANTVVLAAGSWVAQIVVATTGGYVLSVLRPRYAPLLTGMVLSTLFVPSVVLLVPLYLTVLHLPLLETSLLNSYWAVWLPAGANAFNILLVKRFFDALPTELFEAARTDGAGPFRLLWSIVLPLSRPIVGVVTVFAVINSWKDFLWPLLVLPDPDRQPLSVRLPTIQGLTELDVFLAALAISTIIPVALFLTFQRLFLSSAGFAGAVKG